MLYPGCVFPRPRRAAPASFLRRRCTPSVHLSPLWRLPSENEEVLSQVEYDLHSRTVSTACERRFVHLQKGWAAEIRYTPWNEVSADPFVLHYGLQFTMGSAYRYDKHDWSHQDMLTCSATRAGPLFPATPPIESLKGTPDYPKDKEEMTAYKLMEETIEVLNTALAIHHRVRAWVQSQCALPTAAAPRFAGLSHLAPNHSSSLLATCTRSRTHAAASTDRGHLAERTHRSRAA